MASSAGFPVRERPDRDTSKRPANLIIPSNSPGSSPYEDDEDDGAPLPFPAALPRSDFLAPDFEPAAYLSALPYRHQTLEDLRTDLRKRSATISTELLDLVYANYAAFLSLGSELRGGSERMEDVKVALLGFRRAVEEIKARVAARREETRALAKELHEVRTETERGRTMMELWDRLAALEETLAVGSQTAAPDLDWYSDTSDESDKATCRLMGSSPSKVLQAARECSRITTMLDAAQQHHPHPVFTKMRDRLTRCRCTLLDLGNALKEARCRAHCSDSSASLPRNLPPT